MSNFPCSDARSLDHSVRLEFVWLNCCFRFLAFESSIWCWQALISPSASSRRNFSTSSVPAAVDEMAATKQRIAEVQADLAKLKNRIATKESRLDSEEEKKPADPILIARLATELHDLNSREVALLQKEERLSKLLTTPVPVPPPPPPGSPARQCLCMHCICLTY